MTTSATLLLAAAFGGIVATLFVLLRAKPNYGIIATHLLSRPGLAAAALVLTFGAGAVFSTLLASIIMYLQERGESDALANLAYGLLGVLALLLWSLHRLLGSKQAIDLELWKFRARMQSDSGVSEAADRVAEAAEHEAERIKGE